MAVKLHRCSGQWIKIKAHPCWRVEKALKDMGIQYERVPGPMARGKRTTVLQGTGQAMYPAIQFEDGSWYREESKEMERTIREGRLMERARPSAAAPEAGVAADVWEAPPEEPGVADEPGVAEEPAAEEPGGEEPQVH